MGEPQAAGPACDVCGGEPAVVSLMNLADYSTQQLGPTCAGPFLRGVADMFDPPPPAPAPEVAVSATSSDADDPSGASGADDTPAAPDVPAPASGPRRRKAAS